MIYRGFWCIWLRICNKIFYFLDQNGRCKMAAHVISQIFLENWYTGVFRVADYNLLSDFETLFKTVKNFRFSPIYFINTDVRNFSRTPFVDSPSKWKFKIITKYMKHKILMKETALSLLHRQIRTRTLSPCFFFVFIFLRMIIEKAIFLRFYA